MHWAPTTKKDDESVLIPERWLHLHYYEALNILFRMENSLRVFVYLVLKNKFRDKWQDTQVQIAEDKTASIASAVAGKISQTRGFGYLGYEINSPLMYLNSGELTRLIISDAYWEYFKGYFKAKKELIKSKFEEIAIVRNSLAHFRPLKLDDIELIKQNIKHVFVGIEECLNEIVNTYNIVPTNTAEDWYKSLSALSNEVCGLQLYQSKSEQWIRLDVVYSYPVIEERKNSSFASYKILNLISPSIVRLDTFSHLTHACSFVTEATPYGYISGEGKDVRFSKKVSLVFNRDVLRKEHSIVKDQLEVLLGKIKEETALIQEDNLARGSLIESVKAYASLNEKDGRTWWTFNIEEMRCPFGENDPPEYWGDIGFYNPDFIAGSNKYPWMPSDISKEEFPF